MHVKIGVPEVCRDQTLELFKRLNGRLDAMMTNSEKKKKTERKVETFPLCFRRHCSPEARVDPSPG